MGKIKDWILGNVIVKKVIGKFAKHATGAIVGLLFGPKLAPILEPIFRAMELTPEQLEAGLVIGLTASFGAIWNFIEHRFIKNKPAEPAK
jgi:hypothetical protein